MCHSRLTQHPQLKQEGYRHHSNPPEDPHSRSGPQRVNWQLCFLPMPIEKWDSNHPFLLFFLSLLGVNTAEFGLQSSISTAIKTAFVWLSVRSSLYTEAWVQPHQSSSLKILFSTWTWSCFKWNHLKSQQFKRSVIKCFAGVFTHIFPIHPTSVAIASVPQMAASVAVTWQMSRHCTPQFNFFN